MFLYIARNVGGVKASVTRYTNSLQLLTSLVTGRFTT